MLGAILSSYGSCLTEMRRYREAEEKLLEAHGMLKTLLGQQHRPILRLEGEPT